MFRLKYDHPGEWDVISNACIQNDMFKFDTFDDYKAELWRGKKTAIADIDRYASFGHNEHYCVSFFFGPCANLTAKDA